MDDARNPAMPTSAKADGCILNHAGSVRAKKSPTAAPSAPPQANAGANNPPEPPLPTVSEVATAFIRKKQRNHVMADDASIVAALDPASNAACMTG